MCTNILKCTHNHKEFMVQINELLTNVFFFFSATDITSFTILNIQIRKTIQIFIYEVVEAYQSHSFCKLYVYKIVVPLEFLF